MSLYLISTNGSRDFSCDIKDVLKKALPDECNVTVDICNIETYSTAFSNVSRVNELEQNEIVEFTKERQLKKFGQYIHRENLVKWRKEEKGGSSKYSCDILVLFFPNKY